MQVLVKDFDTFSDSGSGTSWGNPGNAVSSDDAYAEASLTIGSTSKLLVCTGADFSAIETRSVIIDVQVIVEASKAGLDIIQIDDLRAWDGSAVQGDDQAAAVKVTTSDVDYSIGVKLWNWWNLTRIKNTSNGIAIRCILPIPVLGATALIDYVRLRVRYIDPSGPGYTAASHFGLVKPALIRGMI